MLRLPLAAVFAALALPLLALDLGPEQPGKPRTAANPQAIAALPADFAFVEPGKLTVAIAPYAPPVATYATDGATVIGFDPEYAQLIADSLGVELNLLPVAWPDWPLGLTSGKYDAVISNVGVTEERKEKFDFATYRLGIHGFYVASDSKIEKIAEPKDVAGLKIITGSGTIQERILLEWNRLNQEAGLAPLELQYFDDEAAADLALLSGRADANFNPNGSQAWKAAQQGKTRLVGIVNAGWPLQADVAIATRKGSGLVDALAIATNGILADGSYQKALERWNLTAEAIPTSQVNPPGLPKF